MTPHEFESQMKQAALDYLAIGEKRSRFWIRYAIASAAWGGLGLVDHIWIAAIVFACSWFGFWMAGFTMRDAIRQRSETLESMERILREKGYTP